ncbi:uncharacterized acetyltransferase At3g50280-like [Lolium rigidum]|uniref:uncharacterized acetyltransferase At3g50280-like n=1 Tax=Lolium rigidum TaxID=89674 RepID=UPI001F5CBF0B|nr:uncharacterized acetyltransferase At3g50280-like [Lolium rigidum]
MGSNEQTGAGGADPVRIISRRMIKPPPSPSDSGEAVNIHLTPWDLRLITIDYIQKGILLPKPPAGGVGERFVDTLASSFERALCKFYPFAGRLVVEPHDGGTVAVLLRCTGEGAEFIHAVAPGVAVADIVGSLHIPSVVWEFFPLNYVLGADAATESLPVLSAQVTELADGVFIGMSMNHSAGDGTAFWEFFNTWSEINRGGATGVDLRELSTAAPVPQRFFLDTCPVPVRLPFSKLRDVVRRFERRPVEECFFTFSAASIQKLKARANSETAATVTISSLQALLAHVWRAVSRARRLPPEQETSYSLMIGCRGRVKGITRGYMGNAVVLAKASSTAGEILDKGVGWTAWQLNRVVASFDEAAMVEWLDRWTREPDFLYVGNLSSRGASVVTGSSPRFDVFGNNFGWGAPVAVRSGPGNKVDGKLTVFEGPERGGSMSMEVCIAPEALERLIADDEFMDAVSVPM